MAEDIEEQFLALCIHEAAHSVVANEVGFIPTKITIHNRTDGTAQYVAIRHVNFYSHAIMVAMAGVEAEFLIFGDASGHEKDDAKIAKLARDGGFKDYHIAAMRRMTFRIVKSKKDLIMATAVRLMGGPGTYNVSEWMQ
jgi:hypothetical protein